MSRLPLDPLSAFGSFGVPSVALRTPRRQAPTLSPEDERSLMQELAARGGSGLAAVGNLLDLPGSMVRDVVSSFAQGEFVNPFDQLLDPLSHSQTGRSVSGRDLLTQMGMRPNVESGVSGWLDDPGEGLRDLAGFGAEVVMDPLFALSLPTKGTRAANAALRGGIGRAARSVGQGVASTRLGEPVARAAGEVGRGVGALFDRSVRGATSPTGRVLGRSATAAERQAGVTARETFAPHIEAFERYAQTLPDTQSRLAANDRLRAAMERPTDVASKIPDLPAEMEHLRPVVQEARRVADELPELERAAGLKSADVDDLYAEYVTRHAVRFPGDKSTRGFPSRLLSGRHPSQQHRKDFLRDIQGGTSLINRLSVNRQLSGVAHTKRPGQLTKDFWDNQEKLVRDAMDAAGAPNHLYEQTRELARWLGDLDPRHVEKGVPIFPHNPLDELALRKEMSERAIGMADTLVQTLKQPGNLFSLDDAPVGSVPLRKVIDGAGLNTKAIRERLGVPTKAEPVPVTPDDIQLGSKFRAPDRNNVGRVVDFDEAGRRVRLQFVNPETGATASKWFGMDTLTKSGKKPGEVHIPKDLADDIGRVVKSFQAPEEVGKLLTATDAATRLWKAGMVSFPAFHSRNLTSGQIANLLAGAFSPRAFKDVWGLLGGKTVKGLQDLSPEFKGLSDEAATRLFSQQAFADDVAPRGQGISLEDVAGSSLDRNLAADIPGLTPQRLRDIPGQAVPRSLEEAHPLNIAGVRTQTDVFAPVRASRSMGQWTEGMNRITPYLQLRRKGLSRKEAAARTRAIQVDYENLSQFERNVMRRMIPFYSFARGQSEFLAKELWRRPGGPFGQVIRGQRLATAQDRPLPEHISQTGAIPIGTEDDGTQSFLTGLGLMHEDPLSFLGGGITGAGLEVVSRTNPLLKAPLEAITGESFFQRGPMGGRELLDMDPPIGRLLTNIGAMEELPSGRAEPFLGQGFEHVMSNLPTSRAVTTLRTLTDPRKRAEDTPLPGPKALANTLTGLRVSDLSPASADWNLQASLGALAREDLGARLFSQFYIPDEVIDSARRTDPAEAERMEKVNAYRSLITRRNRDRRKAEAIQERQAQAVQSAP